ncbi:hypothetical protein [Emcibacter sp.]|uniref:hypothetical protein n=1 Tax=Emcibacter sp. TaxID=1979954 RepID=UPI002AA85A7F|nr:hypothetical protein [Emcibacter sp.]
MTTVRRFFLSLMIGLSLMVPLAHLSVAAEQESFMTDLDLPLFPGTLEIEDERVVFDSPGGRIIKAMASGKVAALEVYDYYRVVVPSLGWKVSQNPVPDDQCDEESLYCLTARRDSEYLVITISFDRQTVIRYSVTPE